MIFLLVLTLIIMIAYLWPLNYHLTVEFRSGLYQIDWQVIGLIGRLRLRASCQSGSVQGSTEFRLLHLFSLRREFPDLTVDWYQMAARFVPFIKAAGDDKDKADGPDHEHDSGVHAVTAGGKSVWTRLRPWLHAARRVLSFVLRRLKVQKIFFKSSLGMGDAARTARIHGCLWTLVGTSLARFSHRVTLLAAPQVILTPVFSQWIFEVQAESKATLRQGEAVIAVLLILWHRLTAALPSVGSIFRLFRQFPRAGV